MIHLVVMPFMDLERPSLALGLLKAELGRAGIPASVTYANFSFAQEVGVQASRLPLMIWSSSLIGEWVFGEAAFPDFHPTDSQYLTETVTPLARFRDPRDPGPLARGMEAELRRLRAAAPAFVDRVARSLLANSPRLIACSSSFSQQVASLALLRRVRELDPTVVTLIGGANVEGDMGAAVVRAFPWVDAIFSGEADEAIVPLCHRLVEGGREALSGPLPEGVITRILADDLASSGQPVPRATVSNLDMLPIPDYDDYFFALSNLPVTDSALIRPGLPMETSRGCWWAAAQPCTFCGLNRGAASYRRKSSGQALAEMDFLAARYGQRDVAMMDNVIPPAYFKSLLPQLADRGAPYRVYYEIRAPLGRSSARLLSAAGVRRVQAGIESLHEGLLTLMRKGTTVLQNVALLKHSREFGVDVGWNLLTGFPQESDDWHRETAEWLPLVHHLRPPISLHGITLQRFSQYFDTPSSYGLNPVPYNNYSYVYSFDESTIRALAYYFRDSSWPAVYPEVNRVTAGIRCLSAAVAAWEAAYRRSETVQLSVNELDADTLCFHDTRSCAPAPQVTLAGLPAHVYGLCDDPVDRPTIAARLAARGISVLPSALDTAIDEIVGCKLALDRAGRVLSLAVPGGPLNGDAVLTGGDIHAKY